MGPCRDTPTALGWWGPSFSDPPCAPLKTTAPLALPPRVPLALTADPPKLEHFNKKTLITRGVGREGAFVLGLVHQRTRGGALGAGDVLPYTPRPTGGPTAGVTLT